MMQYKTSYTADHFDSEILIWISPKMKHVKIKLIFVFLVSFGQHIDVLNVSMRFNVVFCIYEHISKYSFRLCRFF